MRIEDVDEPRTRPEAELDILRTLEHYGFEWDGPVIRQSERGDQYAHALARLRSIDAVYDCVCTRRELDTAPLGAGGERVYPGTCRAGIAKNAHRTHMAQRVRVDDAVIAFSDRLQGSQRQDLGGDVGDFVVRRADALFAYQLAVVVDDAEQQVTSVVRGADLLASTPRQILLQRLLQFSQPEYLHVPVALNAAGEKMSKQTHARRLPDDALPALLAAWRFLDQPIPAAPPASVREFWTWAPRAWSRVHLPPVPALPAPMAP